MERSKIVFIVVCIIIFGQSILAVKNKMTLERAVCTKPSSGSVVQSLHCIFKHVSRTNLKIHFSWTFARPVEEFWIHGVFYYKFNGITFSKFPIELMEDVCGWLNGTANSFLMDWSLSKVLKYSNLNHTCPYDAGPVWIKVDSIREDTFTFENSLMPSGQYRVDVDFMESPSSGLSFKAALYFSISDHRLEIV